MTENDVLTQTKLLSVLIVEDDPRFRESFAQAVTLAPDMHLLGSAPDLATGRQLLKLKPDVMLVDLQLPDGNGLELIREVAQQLPNCDMMVVTIFGDEQHVLSSIEAGATGYLLKDLPLQQLAEQIRILRAGGSPISPVIARQLLSRFTEKTPPAEQQKLPEGEIAPHLSEQETRVLTLTAKGYSYDEIAQMLQVSRHTVQTYVKRIYRKLQVNSKIEAISEARRWHLLDK